MFICVNRRFPLFRLRTGGGRIFSQALSANGKPIFYTYPAAGAFGPDGKIHDVPYYMWTWGCESDAPDAAWEINNWTR